MSIQYVCLFEWGISKSSICIISKPEWLQGAVSTYLYLIQ